jgi:hypothetical protein
VKLGDTIYSTNNKILLEKFENLPAIMCIQQTAEKKIITEENIVESNWKGMGITVGAITNRVTSQIDVLAGIEPGTEEYEELSYRIISGQHFQQNSIDSVKGIEIKPMPSHWYSLRNCTNDFDKRICAHNKPYFMIYRYEETRKIYKDYINKSQVNSMKRFGKTLDILLASANLTEEETKFIEYYYKYFPVCTEPSTMNRICWHIEKETDEYKLQLKEKCLSYNFLKYGVLCHKKTRECVEELFRFYTDKLATYRANRKNKTADTSMERTAFTQYVRAELKQIDKQREVFDVLIDLANQKKMGKQFIWELYGPEVIERIIEVNDIVNTE